MVANTAIPAQTAIWGHTVRSTLPLSWKLRSGSGSSSDRHSAREGSESSLLEKAQREEFSRRVEQLSDGRAARDAARAGSSSDTQLAPRT